jgi:hypothetical protein
MDKHTATTLLIVYRTCESLAQEQAKILAEDPTDPRALHLRNAHYSEALGVLRAAAALLGLPLYGGSGIVARLVELAEVAS